QLEKDNQARRELTIEQRNELAERARQVEELEARRRREVEELEAARARQAEELEAARARQVEELEAGRRREVENLVSQIHSLNAQLADLQSLPTTVEELTAKLTEREQEIERLNKLIEMKDGLLPKFKEHELAHLYLDGLQGLEIGPAAHNPFGLNTRNVAPKEDYEIYAAESRRIHGIEPARIDIWAHADRIPVRDQSEDFILSSHVVEHLPNVIAAFIEWNRVVRDSGYVFMIVPLRDAFEGDVSRELTPFEHFIEDYELGLTLDTHPTDGVPGGRMGHYHTFTPEVLLKVVEYMKRKGLCRWEMIAREDIDTKFGNGFTLVFRVRHNT
ncbi:MAG TPA: methyltransferase domain-containing protein, partial [Blastocatellia bacterium]|nr:methyltransferase domain-containing protein [Blastocatellia bacterium]